MVQKHLDFMHFSVQRIWSCLKMLSSIQCTMSTSTETAHSSGFKSNFARNELHIHLHVIPAPPPAVTLLEITSKPSWKPSEGDWTGPPMELGVAWVVLIHLLWETFLLLIIYEEARCRLNTVGILCFPLHCIYCSLPHFSVLIPSHFKTAVEWN